MANNPTVNKVIYGNDTLIDLTEDDVTAGDVVAGKYFHAPSGVRTVGTAVIPEPATATPLMDGTAAVGTATKYAREDHRHPSDTTKYSIVNYGTGTTDVSVRPLVAEARANRLAFLPAKQVIIEQTTDGGTTWTDAGISDAYKAKLFATRDSNVKIPLLNGAKSALCGVRITITAMNYNVPDGTTETNKYNYWNTTYVQSNERYCNLRELWFWVNVNNDAMRVQVYTAKGSSPNTWTAVFNTDFALTGWSGSDWVRVGNNTFGGGTNQTGNTWNWRIFFWSRLKDGATEFGSATQQQISGINGYGDNYWTASNPLMRYDHLYTWDVDKNVTFPAKVTAATMNATTFTGALSGNATSATTATKVSASAGSVNADRHVWFSDSSYEVNRNYDDDFKYNPSTNTLTVSNVTGNAATATTATKATQDESGNNIKASYGASLDISGTTLSLKNQNGTALNSVTIPSELPAVTSSDNGKVLTVVSGAWEAATGGGSSPSPATANPLMDGTAAVGTSAKYAREDHVHPSDTNKQDTISDLTTIRSNATDGETAYTRSTNKVLYYTSVAVSAGTGDIATVSNAAITADHVVTTAVFADPSKITSQVTWTTAAGSLTLNGTCTAATTANIVLIKKDN